MNWRWREKAWFLALACIITFGCAEREEPESHVPDSSEVAVHPDQLDDGARTEAREELSRLFMSGDTTRLRNGNLLYYTGDRDSIRLVLETPHNRKVIDVEETEFFLDFHNLREFILVEDMHTHLLFATGTNASHSPTSVLVDAMTGQTVRSLVGLLGVVHRLDEHVLVTLMQADDYYRPDSIELYGVRTGTRIVLPNPAWLDSCFQESGDPPFRCVDSVAVRHDSLVLWVWSGWNGKGDLMERGVSTVPPF